MKVYSVEFMRYTNALKDTVSDWDGKQENVAKANYLHVADPFLVKECELEKYQKYGGGYRKIVYVGEMEE